MPDDIFEPESGSDKPQPQHVASTRAAYNVVTDTVIGVNVRKSDNVFQAIFIGVSMLLLAAVGGLMTAWNAQWEMPWYGGALIGAGSVKARDGRRAAASDWMELEQKRGISITSTTLQFPYRDRVVNLLDTPGHRDFSEDTYRVLAAADAAVMVLDAAKGIEPQTLKLFEVVRERNLPLLTFVNKWDRPGRDGLLRLMDAARDRAFDVVIVEALDRLSRDQEDLAGIYKRLTFAGVEIRAVHEGRADGAADEHGRFARTDLVQRLPQRLRHVEARHFRGTGGRAPVARDVDRHAAEPRREPRHLVDPAGLVHRIGMNERHHRAGTAHAFVIERSVDVRHDTLLCRMEWCARRDPAVSSAVT